jgi:hypothetical protein
MGLIGPGQVRLSYYGFWVRSGRVGSVIEHLVPGHFRFWVVLGRVRSVIKSSNDGSFRVSSHIRSGWVGYRVISGFGSY